MFNFAQVITEASQQVGEAAEQASVLAQSAPAVVVALVVFALLRFVVKAAFVTVLIGTIVALVLSGVISFSII
jgi:hypothetical protein